MENNTEQMKNFIENLISTQNELIKNLGINLSTEKTPVDNYFNDIIDSVNKARRDASESYFKEIKKLNEEIEAKEIDINNLNKEYKAKCKELDDKEANIEKLIKEKDERITNLQAEVSNLKENLKVAEEDKKKAESAAEEEIKEAIDSLESKVKIADEFSAATKLYSELLKKILACKSLENYCADNKYSDDVKSTLRFYRNANGTNFLKTIIQKMKEYKKVHSYPVSADEIELMNAINNYAKVRFKFSDDALFLPSGFSGNQVSGVCVPYKSIEMKNISSDFAPKYVTDVITPCLKIEDQIIEEALVKGVSED